MKRSARILLTVITSMLLVVISGASPVQAMVYMWKNTAGVAYYTNNQDEIPVRYRMKAKMLYPEQTDTASQQPGAPAQQQRAVEQPLLRAEPQIPAAASQTKPVVTAPSNTRAPTGMPRKERKVRTVTTEQ